MKKAAWVKMENGPSLAHHIMLELKIVSNFSPDSPQRFLGGDGMMTGRVLGMHRGAGG